MTTFHDAQGAIGRDRHDRVVGVVDAGGAAAISIGAADVVVARRRSSHL